MSTTDSHQVRGGATLNNNTTVFSEISQDFISVPYKRLADFTESQIAEAQLAESQFAESWKST